MEDVPSLPKKSKVRMSRYMDMSSTTQMAQILVRHRRASGSSRTKSSWRHSSVPLVRKDSLRKFFIRTWMGENTELEMYVCSLKTRIILIGIRG